MTVPGEAAARAPETPSGVPVTRREFDALVEVMRELVQSVRGHTHGYNDPGSTYGSDTYGPDNHSRKKLDALQETLDGWSKPED